MKWYDMVKSGKIGGFLMLGGEFKHTADDKGRVSIPAKFRNELGSVFVISKGIGIDEKCLYRCV